MDNLIAKIQLFEVQIINESLLKKDKEVLKPAHHDEDEDDEEFDIRAVKDFNEKEDFELAQALKKAL